MKRHYGFRNLLLGLIAIVVVIGLAFVQGQKEKFQNAEGQFSLQVPPFIDSAYAAIPLDIAEQLDEEAGISAYYQTPNPIDLDLVRDLYRTIEDETTDYIIGSILVSNYPDELWDVHVYVHTDGWIIGYYLNTEPVGKIVDAGTKTIDTTKFTTVLSAVASAAGQPFTGETYYDFRYPNATNMLFVAEDENTGNDFTITLPSIYGYSERSWGAYDTDDEVDFVLDGTNLWNSAVFQGGVYAYGYITAGQLLPDVPHTFSVETNGDDVYAVLVLVYSEP